MCVTTTPVFAVSAPVAPASSEVAKEGARMEQMQVRHRMEVQRLQKQWKERLEAHKSAWHSEREQLLAQLQEERRSIHVLKERLMDLVCLDLALPPFVVAADQERYAVLRSSWPPSKLFSLLFGEPQPGPPGEGGSRAARVLCGLGAAVAAPQGVRARCLGLLGDMPFFFPKKIRTAHGAASRGGGGRGKGRG